MEKRRKEPCLSQRTFLKTSLKSLDNLVKETEVGTIEIGVIKVRLENLVKCVVSEEQIEKFVEVAGTLNMKPLEALEFLESLKLSDEEIKKMIRGL